MNRRMTAIIREEGTGFVSLNPESDIASQGDSIEEARDNLREAIELFFECASPAEIQQRLSGDVFLTQVEVDVGLNSESSPAGKSAGFLEQPVRLRLH